jgi:hypothetical protein
MYDYFLGGYNNFAVDRATAERMVALYPDCALVMRTNRAFLRRAVRYCLEQGIEQFLDLGSGIPTAGNVHEIAQAENPAARVVYVDVDPVAVAHSRALLRGNPAATAIQADALNSVRLLSDPEARRILDPQKPMAVLMVALLSFIPDDEMCLRLARSLRDAIASGSYLVISHGTQDDAPQGIVDQLVGLYNASVRPFKLRSTAEVARLFEGFELVPPGLVAAPRWRPESSDDLYFDHPELSMMLGGIGCKP